MNAQHLGAFIWLRWRLLVNQIRRGGMVNLIISLLLLIGAVIVAVSLGIFSFWLGATAFKDRSPFFMLGVWDVLVMAFLIAWMIGLFSDLQRSEALSIHKFLHLPVSITGVFVLNYVSSLFSLTLIFFVPLMTGLSLGLVIGKGLAMLWLPLLLAAFMLMVTALTYQFQGWLASLMVNKRRRRTIIVVITLFFVVIAQVPNLINMFKPWERVKDLPMEVESKDEKDRRRADMLEQAEYVLKIVNLAIPVGWLPYGAMTLVDGPIWPAPLCAAGMALIGAASLRRAYRTTVRIYTGDFTAGKSPTGEAPAAPASTTARAPTRPARNWLESPLPLISEAAAAIALGGLRSLTRAPEAKLMLITPLIMVLIFGGAFFREPVEVPMYARPLIAFGAMSMILLTLAQLVGNQFGFDRSGFRLFVLSPTPRRDILLGKNLAVMPFAFILSVVMVILVEILYPLRLDHLIALIPQWISMYCAVCMIMNLSSIIAPMPMAQGSFRPTSTKFVPALIRFFYFMLVTFILALAQIPLGVEFILEKLELRHDLPIFLMLSLLGCAGVMGIYHLVLKGQGDFLQRREQRVLEIVSVKEE